MSLSAVWFEAASAVCRFSAATGALMLARRSGARRGPSEGSPSQMFPFRMGLSPGAGGGSSLRGGVDWHCCRASAKALVHCILASSQAILAGFWLEIEVYRGAFLRRYTQATTYPLGMYI